MHTIHIPHEMQSACREVRREGKSIGLVPTMGALHEGHLSLVRAARAQSDFVAVSIYVNPLQFGPNEDLAAYPRTLDADCALLMNEGVDLVFAPSPELMTPPTQTTFIEVEDLSKKLDGNSRPGHFRGVTTIVAKLFEIVRPELAFFGQKDAAQVAVLKKMVQDLNMDVQIVVCPIVREKDGLALSSRNRYLSATERKQALCLRQSLKTVQELNQAGERNAAKLAEAGKAVIAGENGAKLDYFEIVDPLTLEPLTESKPGALVAVAAWIGSTRLIDNLVLQAETKK